MSLRRKPVHDSSSYARRVIVACLAWLPALAEVSGTIEAVCVGPCPLELTGFDCTDTPQSSLVRRVCYDARKQFMIIKLSDTWYPYCKIDPQRCRHFSLHRQPPGWFRCRA